jgi:hypothetical protein
VNTDSKKVSNSPERNTFQKNNYLERCAKEGREPSQAYLEMWDNAIEEDAKWAEQEHQNNLEYDLRTTDWILDKVRTRDGYAQNLYAAMCNNEFTKLDVIPILKEETCSYSWRYAGGIIADMRQEGDYIDWYCSGIDNSNYQQDDDEPKKEGPSWYEYQGYVPEGQITEEIREDLKRLGWVPAKGGDWEKFE